MFPRHRMAAPHEFTAAAPHGCRAWLHPKNLHSISKDKAINEGKSDKLAESIEAHYWRLQLVEIRWKKKNGSIGAYPKNRIS